jgi:aspartate/methionine/tyrosine aminotransferase
MRVSPVLAGLRTYPFVKLTQAARELAESGVDVINFGIGEPREETPEFIRQALIDALDPLSTYPQAEGLPELRAAIAGWAQRRFQVRLDGATDVIPTFGSKEAVFLLAQVLDGDVVLVPQPAYPVYERAAALAREHDFVLASDEAYSEIYFGDTAPTSALQVADLTNVAVFNTLSKRSSMPGYRSGFVAGDPEIVAALKRYRPNVGVAPPEFIQRAAAAAWSDEEHVTAVRGLYRAKRDVLVPALEARGMRHAGGDATFFLWLEGGDHTQLLRQGLVLTPGDYFGDAGAGYLRLALVPTLAECERAAKILASASVRPAP